MYKRDKVVVHLYILSWRLKGNISVIYDLKNNHIVFSCEAAKYLSLSFLGRFHVSINDTLRFF